MCFYLLNLCVNHCVLSFFYFLCDNLLLQKCVQSLCEITVFLCVNLIDPTKKAVLKKIEDELEKMEQQQDATGLSKHKVKSKNSFKNGFKIIDRLFSTGNRSADKQKSGNKQISVSPDSANNIQINFSASFRNSSSQLDTYQELPFQKESVHLTSYSQTNIGADVTGYDVTGASQVSAMNTVNRKSKFTIVDRLQNLIPSKENGERGQKKSF